MSDCPSYLELFPQSHILGIYLETVFVSNQQSIDPKVFSMSLMFPELYYPYKVHNLVTRHNSNLNQNILKNTKSRIFLLLQCSKFSNTVTQACEKDMGLALLNISHKIIKYRGWHCVIVNKTATCDSSIPYRRWLQSQLFHF